MDKKFKILSTDLLDEYSRLVDDNIQASFDSLKDAEISTDTFSFYTSVASVFSSKIEGEDIELDSYIKYKKFGLEFLPDYTRKIDDLYNAYTFAKTNLLNRKNLEKTHQLLSKHVVAKPYQGKIRTHNMYVSTPDGKIAYVTASPHEVEKEMVKLYTDIEILAGMSLDIKHIFFFAALLHLVFVKIHPFNDGNGRTGRLLEKWFLSQKLGEKAWFVQSEKNYYRHHQSYYKNLSILGLEYDELNYSKAMPFLLMLPVSLNIVG